MRRAKASRSIENSGGPFEFVHGCPTSECEQDCRPYFPQPGSHSLFYFAGQKLALPFFRFEGLFLFKPVSRKRGGRARWRNTSGIDHETEHLKHLYLLQNTFIHTHRNTHTRYEKFARILYLDSVGKITRTCTQSYTDRPTFRRWELR